MCTTSRIYIDIVTDERQRYEWKCSNKIKEIKMMYRVYLQLRWDEIRRKKNSTKLTKSEQRYCVYNLFAFDAMEKCA